MWNDDEIVEQTRAVRAAHAAEFAYDLKRIFADLRKQQEQSGREVVTLPAKPPAANRRAAAGRSSK
jgi:hypothetical protein